MKLFDSETQVTLGADRISSKKGTVEVGEDEIFNTGFLIRVAVSILFFASTQLYLAIPQCNFIIVFCFPNENTVCSCSSTVFTDNLY